MRDSNYRIFWMGQTVSWLGCVTQSVAQGWLVWSLTKSPGQLALTAVMVSLPALLFSLLGGVIADRFDKRMLLMTTQAASLLPASLLGLLTACGEITVSQVLALAFLQGTLQALELPARHAFLSELVPVGRLSQALSLNAVSFNATRLIGPALAGFTMAAFGTAPCFFINASSFLVGMLSLLFVQSGGGENLEGKRPGRFPLADLCEGFHFVLNDREVRLLLLQVALVGLLGIPFVPLLPVFADALGVGARGLGVMSACAGGGSLLAAVALSWAREIRARKEVAASAAMLFAAALLVFSRSEHYPLTLFALALAGGALVVFLTLVNRTLQQSSPGHMRGRVMAAYSLALIGTAPLGTALVGGLAATLGTAWALSFSSSLCLAAIVLLRGGGPFSFAYGVAAMAADAGQTDIKGQAASALSDNRPRY